MPFFNAFSIQFFKISINFSSRICYFTLLKKEIPNCNFIKGDNIPIQFSGGRVAVTSLCRLIRLVSNWVLEISSGPENKVKQAAEETSCFEQILGWDAEK